MLVDRAQFEPARKLIAAAKKDLERIGDIRGIIACDREFLGIARQRGDWEQARKIGELLRDVHEQRGSRWGLGLALESLGEVARYTGDLKEAEALYRRSCELLSGVSRASTLSRGSHINIAIVLLEQENYAQTQTFLLDPKHALLKHQLDSYTRFSLCEATGGKVDACDPYK